MIRCMYGDEGVWKNTPDPGWMGVGEGTWERGHFENFIKDVRPKNAKKEVLLIGKYNFIYGNVSASEYVWG